MTHLDNAKSVHLAGWWRALPILLMLLIPALLSSSTAQAGKRATFCPQEYDPVCAEVTIVMQCIRAPCPTRVERRTYANACFARTAGWPQPRIIHKGVCGKPTRTDPDGCGKPERHANPGADPNCKAWTDGCNICRRERRGSDMIACTQRGCMKKGRPRCLKRFGERF